MNDQAAMEQSTFPSQDQLSQIKMRLNLFTVGIYYSNSETPSAENVYHSSGVLVRIKDRFFILTSGQVAKQLNANKMVGVSISRKNNRYLFKDQDELTNKTGKVNYVCDAQSDHGYIEIPKVESTMYSANAKTFLNIANSESMTSQQLLEKNDWLGMAGYPQNITEAGEQSKGFNFTTIVGQSQQPDGLALSSTLPLDNPSIHCHAFCRQEALHTEPPSRMENDFPPIAGLGGSGVWLMNHEGNQDWQLKDIRLIGILTGEYSKYQSVSGKDYCTGISVSIKKHLELLKSDFDDLDL